MRITLPRTGSTPVTFDGEQIAAAETDQKPFSGRTVTIALYKLDKGGYGYMAHFHFTSELGAEPDYDAVTERQDNLQGIAKALAGISPGDYMIPSDDHRIKEYKQMLNSKYKNAITELLSQFPEEI